jgi:hypothetical protein
MDHEIARVNGPLKMDCEIAHINGPLKWPVKLHV